MGEILVLNTIMLPDNYLLEDPSHHDYRPYPNKPDTDVTKSMEDQGWTPKIMFQKAEEFFQSMGMDPMTKVGGVTTV